MIDGKAADAITDSEKRKLFGYVEQSFHMVPGTVKDQITLYDEMITMEDVREAAEALYSQGVKVVAVTLGGEGAYLYGKDGGCMVPGFAVKQIADTNGAGDSFWGGFLYKVSTAEKHLDELTQEDLKEFARFGNAVASLCVEKKGAIPAMPELAQVERRIAK